MSVFATLGLRKREVDAYKYYRRKFQDQRGIGTYKQAQKSEVSDMIFHNLLQRSALSPYNADIIEEAPIYLVSTEKLGRQGCIDNC